MLSFTANDYAPPSSFPFISIVFDARFADADSYRRLAPRSPLMRFPRVGYGEYTALLSWR